MVTLEITLKSGRTIRVAVKDWTLEKSVSAPLSRFSWTHLDPEAGRRTLRHINISEIAAVIEVLPDDWTPDEEEA
jgi:hypothetical protein